MTEPLPCPKCHGNGGFVLEYLGSGDMKFYPVTRAVYENMVATGETLTFNCNGFQTCQMCTPAEPSKVKTAVQMRECFKYFCGCIGSGRIKDVADQLKNDTFLLDMTDEELNWTPLMLACINGQPLMVSMFLKMGAKIDALDLAGRTALDLATLAEQQDCALAITLWMARVGEC